jgi:ppGpp synthetase/RelA/SpoT-type nucleotidyltranferase
MSQAELKYSRTLVNRAGDTLSGRNTSIATMQAWEILNYWRGIHHTPLHYISKNLARHAKNIDKQAFVARRLKRAPSIFSKLSREPKSTLRMMQDIGGCRAIVSDLDQVLKLMESFKKSHQHHILERTKDYIKNPKDSGYRGIHLIYKFQSNDPKNILFNGLRVEVQLRSRLQHSWATAVEIVSVLTKQSLKASQGKAEWLDFFKFVSEAIEKIEKKEEIPQELIRQISKHTKKLDVVKKLEAYRLALDHAKLPEVDFYLLELEGLSLKIRYFNEVKKADEAYKEAELRLMNTQGADVVLAGADSFHKLRRAFPNYFGDSEKFIKTLIQILSKEQRVWWKR